MRLGAVLAVALALSLAAPAARAAAPAAGDPLTAFRTFAAAAAARDVQTMWALTTAGARGRIGRARFDRVVAPAIETELGPLARGLYGISVNQAAASPWWVVAIVGQPASAEPAELTRIAGWAAPLRREAGGWRLELASPITVRALSPIAGERLDPVGNGDRPVPVSASVSGLRRPAATALWLDGRRFASETRAAGPTVTVGGRTSAPLGEGVHAVAAFAAGGGTAAARAWSFTVVPG